MNNYQYYVEKKAPLESAFFSDPKSANPKGARPHYVYLTPPPPLIGLQQETASPPDFVVKIKNDGVFYQQPSFWVSVVALLVSLLTFYLNLKKDDRARRQSIHDEFWLRKVAFPAAMEPMLEFGAEIRNLLPLDASDPAANRKKTQKFLDKFSIDHRLMSQKLTLMQVVSDELYAELQTCFFDIEDTVVTYCHANSNGYQTEGTTHDRASTEIEITKSINSMMLAIRNSQESIR